MRAQPDQVAGNALQFREQNARILDFFIDLVFNTEQLFDGQRVTQVIAEGCQVIHAVG